MERIKTVCIGLFTALSAWLGILAIPMYLLITVNVIDYGTGLAAAKYRNQKINSAIGFHGIAKKVCMWLLVGVGVIVDILLMYAAEQVGIVLNFGYAVGSLAAIWLICNELISVLENVADIDVKLPPFLMHVVNRLKHQVENKAEEALPAETEKRE